MQLILNNSADWKRVALKLDSKHMPNLVAVFSAVRSREKKLSFSLSAVLSPQKISGITDYRFVKLRRRKYCQVVRLTNSYKKRFFQIF